MFVAIPVSKEHDVLLKMLFSIGFIRVFVSKEHDVLLKTADFACFPTVLNVFP